MVDLSSARIVATIPPQKWFGGLDRRAAFTIIDQLQERFGTTFYQLDTTPFIFDDERKQQDAIANLRAYKPQLALSLSNAAYGLSCKVKSENGSANVFTDILNIPLMMLWDHGLFSFPSLVLAPLAERPEDSRPDALRRISSVIDAPLMYHYPLDSGQVSEMQRIGMMHSKNVGTVPALAYKAFLDCGARQTTRNYINDVAFVGNVFLSDRYQAKVDPSTEGRCREAVVAGKLANPTVPAWTLLTKTVEALSASERAKSCLDYDQSYFWHFVNDVINIQCNTQSRMETLRSIKRALAFYGAFVDPAGIPLLNETGNIEYKGYVHFATELPQVYAGTRILVDVTNAAFINNCSTKPICCFASGGFSLFDYKPDPIEHLGSDVERVMFKDFEELNTKIDYFLTHERERESLADHLKDVIRRKSNYTDSVYNPAVEILAERAGTGIWSTLKDVGSRVFSGIISGSRQPLQVHDLPEAPSGSVERIASAFHKAEVEPHWAGAELLPTSPPRVKTADSAWGYSALIPFIEPRRQGYATTLWVEAKVRTVRGRAGVSLQLNDGKIVDERIVSVDDGLQTLLFLLPPDVRGVLVRSAEAPSSILEFVDIALLSERPAA
jgi:hypothetical protein